jgi:hypothetical protein
MRKKRNNNAFDRDFNAKKNITTCYIYHSNTKISVLLKRKDKVATFHFSYNGITYKSEEINMIRDGYLIFVDESQIKVDNFRLNEMHISHLKKCIERMFEYEYDIND